MSKIDRNHVSEIDTFLKELRESGEESASQRQEREQYEKLNRLRDNPQRDEADKPLWEDF